MLLEALTISLVIVTAILAVATIQHDGTTPQSKEIELRQLFQKIPRDIASLTSCKTDFVRRDEDYMRRYRFYTKTSIILELDHDIQDEICRWRIFDSDMNLLVIWNSSSGLGWKVPAPERYMNEQIKGAIQELLIVKSDHS